MPLATRHRHTVDSELCPWMGQCSKTFQIEFEVFTSSVCYKYVFLAKYGLYFARGHQHEFPHRNDMDTRRDCREVPGGFVHKGLFNVLRELGKPVVVVFEL